MRIGRGQHNNVPQLFHAMYYVYILASRRNGTLYTGVTGRLVGRISEHKQKLTPGFSSRYGVDRLVWYEPHEVIGIAIHREKRIKKWLRAWKVELIEKTNPHWLDLYPEFFAVEPGLLTNLARFPAPQPTAPHPCPVAHLPPVCDNAPSSFERARPHVPHHR